MKKSTLVMTTDQHASIQSHLFPGDGLEAAAILVCARAGVKTLKLCVKTIIKIPHEECSKRAIDRITWPGKYIDLAIESIANAEETAIFIHSHPGGLFEFSQYDDASDRDMIPCVFQGTNSTVQIHGTAIMIPEGRILARIYDEKMNVKFVDSIYLVGSEIQKLNTLKNDNSIAFSEDMSSEFSNLTACVVGISGTGSIVAEMLSRLGVGRLILIDFDKVEKKNLNRIINSTTDDVNKETYKVIMMARAIATHHPATEVIPVTKSINDYNSVLAASDADIIFSCVDSIEGRHYCDLMSKAFICPLIDIGVTILTRNLDGQLQISDVLGRIDYVHPDGPSLADKRVVTPELLKREYLAKVAPAELDEQIREGYIKGMHQEAPSVITVNMRAASDGVNEWISRVFPLRHEINSNYSRTIFSLSSMDQDYYAEKKFIANKGTILGIGTSLPLLGKPNLIPNTEIQV